MSEQYPLSFAPQSMRIGSPPLIRRSPGTAWGWALFGPDATITGKEIFSAPASRIPFSISQAISFSAKPGFRSDTTCLNTDSARSSARVMFLTSVSSLTARSNSNKCSVSTSSKVMAFVFSVSDIFLCWLKERRLASNPNRLVFKRISSSGNDSESPCL